MSKYKWQAVEQAQVEFWDEIGWGKSQFELDNPHLIETGYPCGTTALWDPDTGVYYNASGSRLRDPEEYNRNTEGYTPFGDEGY
jgi:hypothetical protein